MASVNRVYAARLAGMAVFGPDGESLGRVRDVVISISIVRRQPRVLGLVVGPVELGLGEFAPRWGGGDVHGVQGVGQSAAGQRFRGGWSG
jgi:sporulation protein YlmC with PRC-barrel domain